jgi:hypothetical protein
MPLAWVVRVSESDTWQRSELLVLFVVFCLALFALLMIVFRLTVVCRLLIG